MKQALLAVILVVVFATVAHARHKEQSLLDKATQLLAQGKPTEALEVLKQKKNEWPDNLQLTLLASRCYRAVGNNPWAVKTLLNYVNRHPDDCTARAALAWTMLSYADWKGASDVLAEAKCSSAQDKARVQLLKAVSYQQAGKLKLAKNVLELARNSDRMYSEDLSLLEFATGLIFPRREPDFEFSFEQRDGWTSNPLLGSPLDPRSSGEDFASPKSEYDLWGRLGLPYWGTVRLALEFDSKGQYLYKDRAEDLSYMGGGVRPLIELFFDSATLRLGYHLDLLWVAMPDKYGSRENLYYLAHRAEFELELDPAITVFAGAGHRQYREMGRTRWEVDFGIGKGLHLKKLFLLGAATARLQRATNDAYNLWGASFLLAAKTRIYGNWVGRLMFLASHDQYPDSAGAEAFHSTEARKDTMLRGRFELWSPPVVGELRFGIRYQPTRRYSTANLYDFTDHTVLFLIALRAKSDLYLPDIVESSYTIGYGLEKKREALSERLQDLLRQDAEAQRGSSCLD